MAKKKKNYTIKNKRGKVILPGFMAAANAFLEKIKFVEIINRDFVSGFKIDKIIFL